MFIDHIFRKCAKLGICLVTIAILLMAGCSGGGGGASTTPTTSTLKAASVIGKWSMTSANSVDLTPYSISLVVDASTYTFVIPISTSNGLTTCTEYGTWSISGNNLTTTPLDGSTCGSSASTDTVSISGSTLTVGNQVYQKQVASSVTSNALIGSWQMMASGTAGSVNSTYSSGYTMVFSTSTYSLSGSSCSDTGTWSVSGSTLSLSPSAGSTCNTSNYTVAISPNNSLSTVTPSSGSSIEVWQKQAGAAFSAPASTIAAGASGGVNINWQLVNGATSYNVYRGIATGTLATKTFVAGVASGTFFDTTAAPGTTYFYQITSVSANGESAASAEVSGTATAVSTSQVPSPVVGLTVTPGNKNANLSWNAVTGATSYNIYFTHTSAGNIVLYFAKSLSTNPSSYPLASWTKLSGAAPILSHSTIGNLVNGDTYQFMVTAVNANGESLSTSYVQTKPVAPTTTWSARASGTAANLYNVAEVQDTGTAPWNLAVGGGLTPNVINANDTGVMLASTDGVTWSPVTLPANTKTLTRALWTNYYYVNNVAGGPFIASQSIAIGEGGTILTSPTSSSNQTTLDGVWTPRTSGTANGLWGITWSSALTWYVAVGDYGTIVTSPDAVTWSVRTSGTAQNLRRIQMLGNKLLAVGWGGTILTSSDGINWAAQVSGTSQAFYGVAYNGNYYVAVGGGGAILTSPDAVTWTAQTSGITSNILDVLWDGSQWVAAGAAGTVLTSPDGITWSSQSTGTTSTLSSINRAASQSLSTLKYIVVGDGGTILTQ